MFGINTVRAVVRVGTWNGLLREVMDAPALELFKAGLDGVERNLV